MQPKNTLCKHYTTKRHECCAAGVPYDAVALDHEPIGRRGQRDKTRSYSCDSRTNPGGATCVRRELPTDAEFAADMAERSAAVATVRVARNCNRIARGYGLAAESVFATRFPPKDFTFSGLGVRGTTRIHTRLNGDGTWDARCGIAVMGGAAETTTWESDPYSEDFRDNLLEGRGATEEAALDALRAEGASLSTVLFI